MIGALIGLLITQLCLVGEIVMHLREYQRRKRAEESLEQLRSEADIAIEQRDEAYARATELEVGLCDERARVTLLRHRREVETTDWQTSEATYEAKVEQLKTDLYLAANEAAELRKDLEAMRAINQSYAEEIDKHRATLAYVVNMIENRHRIIEASNEPA